MAMQETPGWGRKVEFATWLFYLLSTAAAAAAKSLQLCPTLCDPMDCSPPGSSVHGIFQPRVLEWGAVAFYYKASKSWGNIPFLFLFLFLNSVCTDTQETRKKDMMLVVNKNDYRSGFEATQIQV